jgi:hypothetical protein
MPIVGFGRPLGIAAISSDYWPERIPATISFAGTPATTFEAGLCTDRFVQPLCC